MNHHISRIADLTKVEIEKKCPSFFARPPNSDPSFVSTGELNKIMARFGWVVVDAQESKITDSEGKQSVKHMIRWGSPLWNLENERIDIVGLNTFGIDNSWRFLSGLYRRVSNSVLFPSSDGFPGFMLREHGSLEQKVTDLIYVLGPHFQRIERVMDFFKEQPLGLCDQIEFSKDALGILYNDVSTAPIIPMQLLLPRRFSDSDKPDAKAIQNRMPGKTLWHTLCVIQENLLQGGVKGYNRQGKRTKTRKIIAIDKTVVINQGLWNLARTYLGKGV